VRLGAGREVVKGFRRLIASGSGVATWVNLDRAGFDVR